MAERRMFAKTIVLSDAFLDMPLSARCLYFTLGMVAGNKGLINNVYSIPRHKTWPIPMNTSPTGDFRSARRIKAALVVIIHVKKMNSVTRIHA